MVGRGRSWLLARIVCSVLPRCSLVFPAGLNDLNADGIASISKVGLPRIGVSTLLPLGISVLHLPH